MICISSIAKVKKMHLNTKFEFEYRLVLRGKYLSVLGNPVILEIYTASCLLYDGSFTHSLTGFCEFTTDKLTANTVNINAFHAHGHDTRFLYFNLKLRVPIKKVTLRLFTPVNSQNDMHYTYE